MTIIDERIPNPFWVIGIDDDPGCFLAAYFYESDEWALYMFSCEEYAYIFLDDFLSEHALRDEEKSEVKKCTWEACRENIEKVFSYIILDIHGNAEDGTMIPLVSH